MSNKRLELRIDITDGFINDTPNYEPQESWTARAFITKEEGKKLSILKLSEVAIDLFFAINQKTDKIKDIIDFSYHNDRR